jgi:hypothetical protein
MVQTASFYLAWIKSYYAFFDFFKKVLIHLAIFKIFEKKFKQAIITPLPIHCVNFEAVS